MLELAETEWSYFPTDASHCGLDKGVLGEHYSRKDGGHDKSRREPVADVHDDAVHDDADVQVLDAGLIQVIIIMRGGLGVLGNVLAMGVVG